MRLVMKLENYHAKKTTEYLNGICWNNDIGKNTKYNISTQLVTSALLMDQGTGVQKNKKN